MSSRGYGSIRVSGYYYFSIEGVGGSSSRFWRGRNCGRGRGLFSGVVVRGLE